LFWTIGRNSQLVSPQQRTSVSAVTVAERGERPVRDALAVRKAASREDRRALERRQKLVRETCLADARLPVDGEQVGAPVAHRAGESVLEQLELVLAADQRRDRNASRWASVRADRSPDPDGLGASAHVYRADLVDFDTLESEPMRRRAYQDLSRLGVLLKARGEVYRLARRESRVADVGDDFARLDADPSLELELAHRLDDPERCSNGSLGVVLVCLRDAKRGHDRVAGELLDRPAVGFDALGNLVEVPRDAPAHDLGVARGDQRGRIDEVNEENRCEFAFHCSKCKNETEG